MITPKPDYEILLCKEPVEWEEFLSREWNKTPGIWLKFAKKNSGEVSINYDQALDIALCYGWIDSQARSFDEKFYLQKFTPRGKKSIWSKVNTAHIARLTKEGRMKEGGIAQVKAAQSDGRWDQAYSSSAEITMPKDFEEELQKHPKAYVFYQTLNKTNTYAILWRLETAKKPETRARRMKVLLEMLKKEEKLH